MQCLALDERQRAPRRGVEEQAGFGKVGVGHRAERRDFGGEQLPNRTDVGPGKFRERREHDQIVGRAGGTWHGLGKFLEANRNFI